MRSISLFFFCTLTCFSVFAQKITISGYIKEAISNEALIGASVVNANTKTGTSTNQYGFYSIVSAAETVIEKKPY